MITLKLKYSVENEEIKNQISSFQRQYSSCLHFSLIDMLKIKKFLK